MATALMTNQGPRIRSQRLEPLLMESMGSEPGTPTAAWPEAVVEGRSPSVTMLPPLNKSASKVAELLDAAAAVELSGGISPARRGRKQALMVHADGGHKSLLHASMALDQREKDMALTRDGKKEYGRVLLELWVNQILDPDPSAGTTAATDPIKFDPSMLRGLATYGLTRVELAGAGLSNDAIDRLYRCMYVYTVGFFDVMQDVLQHTEFRSEILSNVWKGFLHIAESALQVAFKSDYLTLYTSQQVAMAELLFAKEALAEARQDGANIEKTVGWLTHAHAEERALRQALRVQLEDVASALEKERAAHQAACKHYVDEVENRGSMTLQLQEATDKLQDAAVAHVELVTQRDALLAANDTMEDRCTHVYAALDGVWKALRMEPALKVPLDLQHEEAAAGSGMPSLKVRSTIIKELVVQLYSLWQAQTEQYKSTAASLYSTKDELRESKTLAYNLGNELAATQQENTELKAALDKAVNVQQHTATILATTQEALSTSMSTQGTAEIQVGKLDVDLRKTAHELAETTGKRDALLLQVKALQDTLDLRDVEAARLQADLRRTHDTLQQTATGFAVAWKALQTNQAARVVINQRLVDERRKASDLQFNLYKSERTNRVMESKIDQLTRDCGSAKDELEASVSVQHGAEEKAATLTADLETKELQVLLLKDTVRRLTTELQQAQEELARSQQLAEVRHDTIELGKDEIVRLAAKIVELEQAIQSAAEDRIKLVRQIERHIGEKRDTAEKVAQKQQMSEMELSRVRDELASEKAAVATLEMMLTETRRVRDETGEALQRKRQKKQQWKSLYNESSAERAFLHKVIEEKKAAIEELDGRVGPLEIEIALLLADRGRPLPTHALPAAHAFAAAASAARSTPHGGSSGSRGGPQTVTVDLRAMDLDLDLGPDPTDPGDMSESYAQLDQAHLDAHKLQDQLAEINRELDLGRRELEKCRAVFHSSPTSEEARNVVLGREAVVAKLRAERAEVEVQMETLNARMRQLQSELHTYEHTLSARRIEAVRARTTGSESELQTELGKRLDESEKRNQALSETLRQQKAKYDLLLVARRQVDEDLQGMETSMTTLGDKLGVLTNTKTELENQLRQVKGMVSYLQAEVAAIARDRDSIKGTLQDSENRVESLSMEARAAKDTLVEAMHKQEVAFNAEKDVLMLNFTRSKNAMQDELSARAKAMEEMKVQTYQAEKALQDCIVATFDAIETDAKPSFIFYSQPSHHRTKLLARALAMRKPVEVRTNFSEVDPVVRYVAMSYEMVLVLISQMYVDKMLIDAKGEELLLGGMAGPRASLEDVMYDFFMSRFGARPAAELHLASFMAGVIRYRNQHPKVRVFASLLGLQADSAKPMPLPALEFYLAVLNRLHTRAGPLINEAAEGFSLVKSKIIAKVAREMVKGGFEIVSEDAANVSDTIRHMALNDEEKPIDMETCLEMVLKAFASQYRIDLEQIEALYRYMFEGRLHCPISPDEYHSFLRRISADAASRIDPSLLLHMYRSAMRSMGPSAEGAGPALCKATMDHGFVGISTHLTRLETIKALPHYDEFRLLEESWKGMRTVIEAQYNILIEHPELGANAPSILELARRLEECLETREEAGVTWQLYRKLLVLYCTYKKAADSIKPFTPPPPSSAMTSIFSSRAASRLDFTTPTPGGHSRPESHREDKAGSQNTAAPAARIRSALGRQLSNVGATPEPGSPSKKVLEQRKGGGRLGPRGVVSSRHTGSSDGSVSEADDDAE